MAQRVSKLLLEPDLGRSSFEPVETETRFSARELRVEMKKKIELVERLNRTI